MVEEATVTEEIPELQDADAPAAQPSAPPAADAGSEPPAPAPEPAPQPPEPDLVVRRILASMDIVQGQAGPDQLQVLPDRVTVDLQDPGMPAGLQRQATTKLWLSYDESDALQLGATYEVTLRKVADRPKIVTKERLAQAMAGTAPAKDRRRGGKRR